MTKLYLLQSLFITQNTLMPATLPTTPKLTFQDLWLGDRFIMRYPENDGKPSLWTKTDITRARKHSEASQKLADRGYGYIGDNNCSFEMTDLVEFVPVDTSDTEACEALLAELRCRDEAAAMLAKSLAQQPTIFFNGEAWILVRADRTARVLKKLEQWAYKYFSFYPNDMYREPV